MSTTPKNGTFNLLYIDEDTPITTAGEDVVIVGNFKPVACLTDNGFDGSRDSIDTSGKCLDLFKSNIPGQAGFTFSGSGFAVQTTGSDIAAKVNHNRLFQLFQSGEQFWAATIDTDLYSIRYGLAFISAFAEANPNNAGKTFTITLQGSGQVYDQTQSS